MDDQAVHYRNILGGNISRLRHAKKLSQQELADKAGMSKSFVAMVERSASTVSLDKIVFLAVALGVEPYALIVPPK